jgi:hypothetical protein
MPVPTVFQHTAIYDPLRDRMIVFGGSAVGDIFTSTAVNELTAFDLWAQRWTTMFYSGDPAALNFRHTAIYDPVRDRMLVCGGLGAAMDVYQLTLSGQPTWSKVLPAGTPPSTRYAHSAIYDPLRDRMIVCGGKGSAVVPDLDVWALSLSGTPTWTQIAVGWTPIPSRYDHSAIYDPVRDRMVIYGGVSASGSGFYEAWALPLTGPPAWEYLNATGTPPLPTRKAVYDPVRDRLVVAGPGAATALTLGTSPAWTPIPATGGVPTRDYETLIYDPVGDRVVLFGGEFTLSHSITAFNDVRSLNLSGPPQWSTLSGADLPSARADHAAIVDTPRRRMIMFGGSNDSDPNVWSYDLSESSNPTWSALQTQGTPAPPRRGHTMTYDPSREDLVLIGGSDLTSNVWTLSLSQVPQWTQLSPSGPAPPPRYDHTTIYDPVGDRMIVFGGTDGVTKRNDVWALSRSGTPAWTQIIAVGAPPDARSGHTAIYDPVRQRMIVFGGHVETWALDLSGAPTWTQLFPSGVPPPPLVQHTAIYDPLRDRMVVFGGGEDQYGTFKTWVLSLSDPPTWNELPTFGSSTVPSILSSMLYNYRISVGTTGDFAYHSAVYDAGFDRMVVFGGTRYSEVFGLNFSPMVPTAVDRPLVPAAEGIVAVFPNPSFGSTRIDFVVGRIANKIRIDVIDIAGRIVDTPVNGMVDPGRHTTVWRGDRRGAPLPVGTYFVRWTSPEGSGAKRIVLLR